MDVSWAMTEEEPRPKPKWPFGRHTPVLDIEYGTDNETMTESEAQQLADSVHMENDITGQTTAERLATLKWTIGPKQND